MDGQGWESVCVWKMGRIDGDRERKRKRESVVQLWSCDVQGHTPLILHLLEMFAHFSEHSQNKLQSKVLQICFFDFLILNVSVLWTSHLSFYIYYKVFVKMISKVTCPQIVMLTYIFRCWLFILLENKSHMVNWHYFQSGKGFCSLDQSLNVPLCV